MKYVFIAYKPDSANYSMSCLVDSFYGDFEICECESDEKLIKIWADYIFKNEFMRGGESGYKFYITKDSRIILEEGIIQYDFDYDEDENYESKPLLDPSIMERAEALGKNLIKKKKDADREKKKLEKEKERVEREKAKLEKDKAEYERLKKKFG